MGIAGNGASYKILQEAGIDDADLIIAVTGSDEPVSYTHLRNLCNLLSLNLLLNLYMIQQSDSILLDS